MASRQLVIGDTFYYNLHHDRVHSENWKLVKIQYKYEGYIHSMEEGWFEVIDANGTVYEISFNSPRSCMTVWDFKREFKDRRYLVGDIVSLNGVRVIITEHVGDNNYNWKHQVPNGTCHANQFTPI
jgi:hypothetical protein